MKHSKKSKNLQEPHHNKFSCLLACFGGGQPSGKKLAFDHVKKSHHHHRWLLSPYWSKVRLRRPPSSSKTVPYDFISVSPQSSTKSKSWSGREAVVKAAESIIIGVEENPDQKASLVFKEKLRSSIQNKTPIYLEEGEDEDLSQKSRNSDSRKSNKTPTSKLPDSLRPSKVDPSIGLSIVILTLLIMIIWGRVCAILCTSAWLYFVPRFHLKEGKSKCENKSLDLKLRDEGQNLTMKDYKKKVILEGFLDRKNRQSFG